MRPFSPERLDALVEEFAEVRHRICRAKAAEYSPGADRLQNFHQVAAFMGCKASEVALMYLLKHVQALQQAVRTGKYVWAWTTHDGGEGLKQRVVDVQNYADFLAAALEEEAQATDAEETSRRYEKLLYPEGSCVPLATNADEARATFPNGGFV